MTVIIWPPNGRGRRALAIFRHYTQAATKGKKKKRRERSPPSTRFIPPARPPRGPKGGVGVLSPKQSQLGRRRPFPENPIIHFPLHSALLVLFRREFPPFGRQRTLTTIGDEHQIVICSKFFRHAVGDMDPQITALRMTIALNRQQGQMILFAVPTHRPPPFFFPLPPYHP